MLNLGKGLSEALADMLSVEKICSINFTEYNKKSSLSLHYNRGNGYLFLNDIEIHKFKAEDSNIVATWLCLGKISKEFQVNTMNNIGLNRYVYDFSVDYDAIATTNIMDTHSYLAKRNNMR